MLRSRDLRRGPAGSDPDRPERRDHHCFVAIDAIKPIQRGWSTSDSGGGVDVGPQQLRTDDRDFGQRRGRLNPVTALAHRAAGGAHIETLCDNLGRRNAVTSDDSSRRVSASAPD